ncbi:hypothetical protein [Chitinophaga defluvii]|uniref:Uncharacterized protein n=1 Tax=Chitinophaga defluvii TaxID=3163343 RepID=A0ABV2T5K6_9BACT
MKKLLLLSVIICLAYACKKDSLSSKPQISFRSYSISSIDTTTQQFDIEFNVKDGDGDIENNIYILNYVDGTPPVDENDFPSRQMPGIEANKGNSVNAIVSVNMQSNDFRVGIDDNFTPDSFHVRAFIIDNAGNSSDTITTPKIPWYKKKQP